MNFFYLNASELDSLKHVIGNQGAGFFSCFHSTLNQIMWCEEQGKIPVVYWGENSQYYDADGYSGRMNAWEYYFEPVSHLTYDKDDIVDNTNRYSAQSQHIYLEMIDIPFRIKINQLIGKYIRIRPHIKKKIDDFYKLFMTKKRTIGIHLRGTDKHHEEHVILLDILINKANQFADGNTQFYVASEDQQLFDRAKSMLKGPVISYNVTRVSTDVYQWPALYKNRAQLGEEVLIEAQLLAKCNLLIHTLSNVSSAVLYFNPNMKNILFYCPSRMQKEKKNNENFWRKIKKIFSKKEITGDNPLCAQYFNNFRINR